MVIEIHEAKYLGEYKIQLTFSDGKVQEIDFGPFLKKARNPMTNKFLDKNLFKQFHLDHGDLVWGDFEMCFPIWDLYEGRIE